MNEIQIRTQIKRIQHREHGFNPSILRPIAIGQAQGKIILCGADLAGEHGFNSSQKKYAKYELRLNPEVCEALLRGTIDD